MSTDLSAIAFGILPRWKRVTLAIWFLLTMLLGTTGYLVYGAEGHEPISWLTALYHTAQLFLLHAPHFDRPVNLALEAARWSAALFTGGAAYQIATQLFRDELLAWRLHRVSGHLIVCGLGRRGLRCVQCERRKGMGQARQVVVIDHAPPADLVEACSQLGAQVVVGDATDPLVLGRAGVARASELYALTADDSVNCETAVQSWEILRRSAVRGEPFRCNVHLSDLDLRTELQRHASALAGSGRIALRFFDLFEVEAHRVLLEDLPIDHDGVGVGNPRRVHLVILGFGRMGRALAVRAAKVGHFANATRDPKLRLRISVIDRASAQREDALLFRYPNFRNACDLEFHHHDVESVAARKLIEGWCADPGSLTSVAVCFDDEPRAVEVALRLVPILGAHGVRVVVRLARRTGLASMLGRLRPDPAGQWLVRGFGMLEEECCEQAFADSAHERLAKRIHADFVERRMRDGRDPASDSALAPWMKLEEWFRESNRQQADHIPVKLRAIGCQAIPASATGPEATEFTPDEIEIMAQMEHDRWNAERWLAGWAYAPGPKDEVKRTSPFLVPWAALADEVREYDRDAVRLIPELYRGVGMLVCRSQDLRRIV